jgi:uncharacterized membrane protein YgcG
MRQGGDAAESGDGGGAAPIAALLAARRVLRAARVRPVLRAARVRPSTRTRETHPTHRATDLELALSPSGRAAAVVELRRQRVKLLAAGTRFAPAAAATFEPMPIEADGEESPDVVTNVAWGGPAPESSGGGGGSASGGGASSGGNGGGERLLVTCQSSCVYLLSRCGPWREAGML